MRVTPDIDRLRRHIDWSFFFAAWQVPGRYPDIFAHPVKGDIARRLYADAVTMLDGRYPLDGRAMPLDLHPAGIIADYRIVASDDPDILMLAKTEDDPSLSDTLRLPMYRSPKSGVSAADFVTNGDIVKLFVLSGGFGLDTICNRLREHLDDYGAFMAKILADRLAEAMADMYIPGGCRLAIGYPSLPDHSLKRLVINALSADKDPGFRLTESNMIIPAETVCGIWMPRGHYFD